MAKYAALPPLIGSSKPPSLELRRAKGTARSTFPSLARKVGAQEKKCAILRRVILRPDFPGAGKKCLAICAGLLLASQLFAATRTPPVAESFLFEALPLERSQQNHMLVRAYINGKAALLCVDTGAPVSAIAIERRKHFGLTPIPGTSKLPARVQINGVFSSVVIARKLQLGVLTLVDAPMVAIDLSNSTRAARLLREKAIDGILGTDILFPTGAVIDCQRQTLIFKLDPRIPGGVPGFDFRGFRGVPMHVSANYNFYVDGAINGSPARLMVDTGAFATLMHQRFIRRMNIPLRNTRYTSAGINLKQRGLQLATISRLSIGKTHFRKKEVGVMDLQGLIHDGFLDARQPVAGLLGSEILQRHHGIIDFGTRTLYLKR